MMLHNINYNFHWLFSWIFFSSEKIRTLKRISIKIVNSFFLPFQGNRHFTLVSVMLYLFCFNHLKFKVVVGGGGVYIANFYFGISPCYIQNTCRIIWENIEIVLVNGFKNILVDSNENTVIIALLLLLLISKIAALICKQVTISK